MPSIRPPDARSRRARRRLVRSVASSTAVTLTAGMLTVGMLTAALLTACAASTSMASADRDVARLLETKTDSTLGTRAETVQLPERREEEVQPPTDAPAPDAETRVLALTDALSIAVRSNRDVATRKESLYLSALSLVGTRHQFAPQLDAALSYLYSDATEGESVSSAGFSAGVSQELRTGGRLSLSGDTGYDSGAFSTSLRAGLTQPLLRGAGEEVAWEPLTQAERGLVYAIRDYELFLEDFSIDTARRFYDLVQQQQSVENEQRNLEKLEFTRRKAEALFAVGRVKELDVLRARRDELSSQNRVLEAQEGYRSALESFRIYLGLPPGERIDVQPQEPLFVTVDYDVASAVDVALANRLDLKNREEQLEDVERGVRIARQGLRPDLNLDLSYGLDAPPADDFSGQTFESSSWSAGLRLDLPVDRLRERNALRSAQIALSREKRSLEEFRQELAVGVENSFRELERRAKSLEIQTQLIADQERNVRVAELLFERGENDNRDVVEALQSLVDAQNALIDEKVSYEIARLRLMRDLGILFVDAEGMWVEP